MEFTGGDLKSRVLEATDIVDLIGRTVRLQRRGKEMVGLCPFHQEKTPSFKVDPTRQTYYCFGCKKHGNAIDFLIERDRVEFMDAMRTLAEAASIPVAEAGPAAHRAGEMQILRDANAAACMFFEKQLSNPSLGKPARDYLQSRGFSDESIKRFHIGFAAAAWDGLLTSPGVKKFTPAQLAMAGLLKPRQEGEGHYDTFRNRLMFPIRDPEGRVIAFGGRKMPDGEDPKYLNSPQTPLFDKGRCAFGLDLARQKIVETRTVAVVEGYTDVVMAHQFGCTNVVSTLGTALTPKHLALLGRFADRVVLLFDPDAAGDAAVDRAIELALSQDKLELAVATLPDGLDPDEFILKNGAAAFDAAIAAASDAVSYKWKQLTGRMSLRKDDLLGQNKAVEEFLTFLSAACQKMDYRAKGWDSALTRVARLTGQSVAQLQQRAARLRPARSLQARTRVPAQVDTRRLPKTEVPTARDRAESFVLGYLLCEPGHWAAAQKQVGPHDFTPGPRRTLAEKYWQHQCDEGEPVLNEFLLLLEEEPAVKLLAVELAQDIARLTEPEKMLPAHLQYLEQERERLNQRKLHTQLRDGAAGDEAAILEMISASTRIPDPRRLAVPYGA